MSAGVNARAGERERVFGLGTWSPARIGGGLVLAAWATLFWFLLATGRDGLYLSARTRWVVPVGAVLLTVAAIGRLASARARRPEPLSRRDAWVYALMVVPVVAVLSLPPTSLGSFSASRRTTFAGSGFTSVGSGLSGSGPITLFDVAAAQTSKEGQRALAKRAGEDVSFIGFVTRYADTPADEFLLTRYIITCCVADATIAQVRVVDAPAGAVHQDEWVQVSGRIYPLGREVLVDAGSVRQIPQPKEPYLTP